MAPPFQSVTLSLLLCSSIFAQADLITHDSFDVPEQWGAPEKWVSDEPSKDHARVSEGSLYYAGLQESVGNRLGLGEAPADYNFDFPATDLAVGESVYFSFLVRIEEANEFGDISPMLRLSDSNDKHGGGVCIGHGSADISSGLMAFSLHNRNRGYGETGAARTEENLPIGETYLLVASYTRGSGNNDNEMALWVNPKLGVAAPLPTLTFDGYRSDAVWDRLSVRVNGSSTHPASWAIDEVRIGTSWEAVTPTGDTKWIPEPKSYALIFGLIAVLAFGLRRLR